MATKILFWIKRNYEKLVLFVFVLLLIIVGLHLLVGENKERELQAFEETITPPQKQSLKPEPIYNKDLTIYLIEKSYSAYKAIENRAVFFPPKPKEVEVELPPEMNLKCTEIVYTGEIFTATLRNDKTGKTYTVMNGTKVEDFTVVAVDRDGVTLSGAKERYTLKPPAVVMPFKLTGIMPTDTGLEGMLQSSQTKRTYFVRKDDKVEGWTVLSIEGNTVIISREDAGKYELRIGGTSKRMED